MNFVDIWNSSNDLTEVCERTGKTRRKAASLASSHRASGKNLKFFPRPAEVTRAIVGESFGRWTVIAIVDGNTRLCQCVCGTVKEVSAGSLASGASTGCYCTWRDRPSDPNAPSSTPEYKTWVGMRIRCKYPGTSGYENYGGRGIKVCERWDHSFENFLVDMGKKPTPQHTIERIDPNGNYEPGNCRWATDQEQRNNTRANHFITINGRKQTLTQWCQEVGKNIITVSARLRNGWSEERAIMVPVDERKRNRACRERATS